MLIIDVEPTPAVPEPIEERRLSKQELHMRTQQVIVEAAQRYEYDIGLSDEFEGPIWKKVDSILRSRSQEEAERAAAGAEEFGLLSMSVWHKKVR